MITYQVNVLNPKATKLLQDLADLNLISLQETATDDFLNAINAVRKEAATDTPTLEEITEEVEVVRAKRYASNKK